jgi:assimilatory nitrate reductase catalytic subunit
MPRYQLPRENWRGSGRAWGDGGKSGDQRGQRPGSLFVPMHWNNQFARQGRVNNLLAAVTDPYSGQPESKQAAVAIAAWQPAWHGELFVASRFRCPAPGTGGGGRRRRCTISLAGEHPARQWLSAGAAAGWQMQVARRRGVEPAGLASGKLMLGWWSDAREPAVDAAWISARFRAAADAPNDMRCLAGKKRRDAPAGRIVCSCFSVGERRLTRRSPAAAHVGALGGS